MMENNSPTKFSLIFFQKKIKSKDVVEEQPKVLLLLEDLKTQSKITHRTFTEERFSTLGGSTSQSNVKVKSKLKVGDLVRTSITRFIFSKDYPTNRSEKFHTNTGSENEKIPSYQLLDFPDGFNGALLKNIEVTVKPNKLV